MGKNRHSKDRLFITQTEHKYLYGGKKQEIRRAYKRASFCPLPLLFGSLSPLLNPLWRRCYCTGLPFNCCAITLCPFTVRTPCPVVSCVLYTKWLCWLTTAEPGVHARGALVRPGGRCAVRQGAPDRTLYYCVCNSAQIGPMAVLTAVYYTVFRTL